MSTLILTCDTGEGHNSCAMAIKEVYDAAGVLCEIINPVEFVSKKFSRFVHRTHTTMYQKFPRVFKHGYHFTQDHHGATTSEGALPYRILDIGSERLHEYIVQHHVTGIICVHPLLMMMVTQQQKKYHLDCPVAFVATDYTCSPGVHDGKPAVCFIPDMSVAGQFCCENISMDQIIASGIPVRQQFYKKVDSRYAKTCLGIPEDAQHLLLMCGSMGCGPMEEILALLVNEQHFHVTAVCGNNRSLYQKLSNDYENATNIHICGFVEDISLLMDSADLFVTKPGGLSSTEAAVKHLPAVYINAVGGCESYNMDFFVQRGCAVAGDSPAEVASLCGELLHDPQRLQRMHQSLIDLQLPNAARTIFEAMGQIQR